MINNQDAGDISGLEEVFRSQEFARASGTTAVGPAGADLSLRRGDGILGTRFGRRPVAAPVGRTEDDAGSRRTPDAVGSPGAGADEDPASKEPSSVPSSGAGAGPGKGAAGGPFVWRRHSSRYWTIASVSALERARRGGHHGRDGSAPAVACGRPSTTWRVSAGRWAQHLGCGVNGLGGSGWPARGRGWLRRPFVGGGHEQRASFEQRARWTRHPDWGGDLHRRSGLASAAPSVALRVGLAGLAGLRVPAACGYQSGTLPSCPPSGAR